MHRVGKVVLLSSRASSRPHRHEGKSSFTVGLDLATSTTSHFIYELGHVELVVVNVRLLDHAGMCHRSRINREVRHDAHVVELAYFSVLLYMENLVIDFLFARLGFV